MSAPEPENTNNRNTRKGGRAYNFNNNKRLYMKEIFCCFLGTIGIFALLFVFQVFDYNSLLFWKPKYENANRIIFEQTKSFRDGSTRDLDNLRIAYYQDNAETKQADPVYVEPDVIVSPFRLTAQECVNK